MFSNHYPSCFKMTKITINKHWGIRIGIRFPSLVFREKTHSEHFKAIVSCTKTMQLVCVCVCVFVYVVLKTGGVLEGVGDSCQLHQVRSMMKAPMKAVPLARYHCSLKNSLEICGTQAACASVRLSLGKGWLSSLGSAVLYQFSGGIFKLLRSCHECCSSNPCHVLT